MDHGARRRPVDDDDSLLASVAGVPLTRMARIGVCAIWAGFWCARVLLTDALAYFQNGKLKLALTELLGKNTFDQGFSLCMAWLTVEVAIIAWDSTLAGAGMLIAKTPKSLLERLADYLPQDKLDVIVAAAERKRKKADADDASAAGKRKG